ncbi:hypothetical protein NPIL_421101 [Nephila pilipes]|uniref:TGF-beta family profile domain-containing protein n=1 Tax=Nephila pilipes TaxID=299642 RepID=A0A8X6QGK3_NEPPI|nr:hypothetical protein NPIL_421101 [Nephila pilipes]
MCRKLFFVFLLTLLGFSCWGSHDTYAEIKEKVKALCAHQTIPNALIRFYLEWFQSNSCVPEALKSYEVQVRRKQGRYVMTSRIVCKSAFIKAELWIELYGIFKKKINKRKYFIDIRPVDSSKINSTSLQCGATVTNGNVTELSFDMTTFYTSLKKLNRKVQKFSIHLRHRKKRRVLTEFRGATVKAFVVLHKKNEFCTKVPSKFRTHEMRQSVEFQHQTASELSKLNGEMQMGVSGRVKRDAKHLFNQDFCSLKNFNVSFEKLNFDKWIIAPVTVDIKLCSGKCFKPKDHVTTHSIFRWYMSFENLKTKPTCCVPTKYAPQMLVQYDEKDDMISIVQYSDMIATQCGCH